MDKYLVTGLWILGAYLIGSIPFGFIIGRLRGVDVRTVGSKNIGATNVFRTVGKKWGLLAFLCDFLKGFLPTLAAKCCVPAIGWLPVAVGLAAVVGHTLTVFMKFKGGKGVATAFGMLVALVPGLVGIAFAVFVALFALTNYISLGSCGAAAFIAVAVWFTPAVAAAKAIITLIGVFVIVKHRSNIVRLIAGNENKIYFFRRPPKVYGVIPSRFGSSRFPGKPLAELAGKPLVAWVVEAAKKAASLDEVMVATDDERIVEAVVKHGGRAVMTPSELPSGTDRIAAAAGDFADDDILVNIQGDEPLIDPGLIDRLVEKLRSDRRWSMATAVTPIRTAEDLSAKTVVKVVLDRDDGALYFSRAPIPCDRDREANLESGLYVRHLGIYAYRGGFLRRYVRESPCALENTERLEQLRALWMGERIAVVRTDDEGVGVDTPEDAKRVEKLLIERMRGEA